MSDTTTLRDHTKQCEHDESRAFRDPVGLWTCNVIGCPGGQEHTLEKRFLPNGQWFYATELEGEPSMAVPVLDLEVPDGQ